MPFIPCRALGLALITIVAANGLSAQLKKFPWVNRSDPKITVVVLRMSRIPLKRAALQNL